MNLSYSIYVYDFDCNESNQQFTLLLLFFFDETSNKMKHHINLKPDTNSYNSVFFVCRLIIYIAKVFSNLSDCERKKENWKQIKDTQKTT